MDATVTSGGAPLTVANIVNVLTGHMTELNCFGFENRHMCVTLSLQYETTLRLAATQAGIQLGTVGNYGQETFLAAKMFFVKSEEDIKITASN